MSEWFKVRAWKARVPKRYRGFESPSFRNMRPDAPQVLLTKPRQRRNPATVCTEGCAGDYLTSFFHNSATVRACTKGANVNNFLTARGAKRRMYRMLCRGLSGLFFSKIQQRYAHAPKVQTSIISLQRAERSDACTEGCAGDYLASFY